MVLRLLVLLSLLGLSDSSMDEGEEQARDVNPLYATSTSST